MPLFRKKQALFIFLSSKFATMSSFDLSKNFVMDAFCIRQFNNPDYTGTQVNYSIQQFEDKINELFNTKQCQLVDGYAPFW
jgi:hypothetical protein